MKTRIQKALIAAALGALLISGCGGSDNSFLGDSGGSGTIPTATASTGYFVDGPVDVGETVDFFPGYMGSGGHDVLVFGAMGHFICFGHRLHGRPDNGIIHHIVQLFSKHVYHQM